MTDAPIAAADVHPPLEPGINVLFTPERRSPTLHQLVVAALLEREGTVYWVDARNNASTYALYDVAPSPRTLEPLRIARAFTAYQHHALVRTLARRVSPRTALVVAPAIADLYRDDDVPEPEDRLYLEAAVAILRELAATFDLPVLVTACRRDGLLEPVTAAATREIAVESTRFGHRYVTDGFETTVYWSRGSWQTTIPYWVELLGAAEPTDPAAAAALPATVPGAGAAPGTGLDPVEG